jgi:hypothetical protein
MSVDREVFFHLTSFIGPKVRKNRINGKRHSGLAQTPSIRMLTVKDVVDAAISELTDGDGFTIELKTSMDKALDGVARSEYRKQLHERLLARFVNSRNGQRNRIGCCAAFLLANDSSKITADNAEALIARAQRNLSSDQQTVRLRTALELVNRFFVTDGRLGFLTLAQQEQLLTAVFSGIRSDEATASACMWALVWLTRAKVRSRGPEDNVVPLDSRRTQEIEQLLQVRSSDGSTFDDNTLASGCMALSRERELQLVVHQRDWIYELAVIADGGKPRRELPPPGPTGRRTSVDWMKGLLKEKRADYVLGRIAQTLGAFGVYIPEMATPLEYVFTRDKYVDDERDEALLYLGLVGTKDATSILS